MVEILVLGYPRTGTQSLAEAIKMLGGGECYHMREVGKNKHQEFWIEALEAKYKGEGKLPGREEFDGIFKGFNGTSDLPSTLFASELLSAYPDARVILSVRPFRKWYDSMLATLYHHYNNLPPLPPDASTSGNSSSNNLLMRKLSTITHQYVWNDDFPNTGPKAYEEHNEMVRRACKEQGRDLLEYQPGDGWEELAKFLGKEVPTDEKGDVLPYPRQDDWAGYKKAHAAEMSKSE